MRGKFVVLLWCLYIVSGTSLRAEDSNPLADIVNGLGYLFFEAPQGLASAAVDLVSSDINENKFVKSCCVPLDDVGGPPIPFDHVFLQSKSCGEKQEWEIEEWTTGDLRDPFEPISGNLLISKSLSSRSRQSCFTVNNVKTRNERINQMNSCERADLLHCITEEVDSHFEHEYALVGGANCGDVADFLLSCAGMRKRVDCNLDVANIVGYSGKITPRADYLNLETGEVLEKAREYGAKVVCEAIRTQCEPCPIGTYRSGSSCRCYDNAMFSEEDYLAGESSYCFCPGEKVYDYGSKDIKSGKQAQVGRCL